MWLAETAANRHVLDLLAREGIKYTILAPNQCARRWRAFPLRLAADADAAGLDRERRTPPSIRASLTWSNSTKAVRIAVFFYDGPGSRAIAFEGLLDSGEKFATRLLGGARHCRHPIARARAALARRHRRRKLRASSQAWRDGALLRDALDRGQGPCPLTNYGEFLEKFPPTWEAEVAENTSWSCSHGMERWRSDCGCNGGKPGWNQKWRKPLREALDYLRDATAPLAEKLASGLLLIDLWAARDAYIHVVLRSLRRDRRTDSSPRTQPAALTPEERTHGARADGARTPRPADVHLLRLVLR